jgi:hypothetical protein
MGSQKTSCTLLSCDAQTVGIMQLALSICGIGDLGADTQKGIKPLTSHRLCCYMLSES